MPGIISAATSPANYFDREVARMSEGQSMPGELEDTDSYDLAQDEPEETETGGSLTKRTPAAQWKLSSRTVEENLAEGLSNEDLWMLIRRFNKQIYYLKAVSGPPPQDIDLNRAEDEQFPPEKLRMTLERFYTSVVVGIAHLFKHIGRLRSWKEPIRTSVFCVVYFGAWLRDLLIPAIISLVVCLIICPPMRPLLFPPVVASMDDSSESSRKPVAEEPESHDSITGAPESHKGEAAEQEAINLVNSVATVAMKSAAAKYGQGVPQDASEEPPTPDEGEVVTLPTETELDAAPEDKTKKPMKKKVANATDKTMRVISDITDIYEKLANLLSPTPPFITTAVRLRLAGILIAVCVIIPFTSSYWIIKSGAFTVGLCFFGDPVFQRTLVILNSKFPNWKKHLDIQMTLLKGVPTNAQLTLTLLRIGEINSAPLPPPPGSQDNERSWPLRRKKSQAKLTDRESGQNSTDDLQRAASTENLPKQKPKKRWVFKVLRFVRQTIATAIKGHIAFDRAIAIAGSTHTKNLIGMLQKKGWLGAPFGPLKFDAKYQRKRGAVVIDSSKEPPTLYFTTYQSAGLDDLRLESRKKGSVLFQIPVPDITELKKTEGLGWKGKLIVELTAGSKESADGLVIGGKGGESFHLTGMRARNQLFNRLVAIDAQFWESH